MERARRLSEGFILGMLRKIQGKNDASTSTSTFDQEASINGNGHIPPIGGRKPIIVEVSPGRTRTITIIDQHGELPQQKPQ